MTREEHMQWCKERAHRELKECGAGSAIASMASDIMKHDETKMAPEMMGALIMAVSLDSGNPTAVARWIDGFN